LSFWLFTLRSCQKAQTNRPLEQEEVHLNMFAQSKIHEIFLLYIDVTSHVPMHIKKIDKILSWFQDITLKTIDMALTRDLTFLFAAH